MWRSVPMAAYLALGAFWLPFHNARAFDVHSVVGGTIGWIGDRTGIKPLSDLGASLDDASRSLKKKVPIYKDIDETASRPVRETFKWIAKNPEKAAIIAAVAVGGWAACLDGCEFIANIIVASGHTVVAVPVAATAGAASGIAAAVPILIIPDPRDKAASKEETKATNPADDVIVEKDFPKYYSKTEYPSPRGMGNSVPKLSFKAQSDKFPNFDFAYPSADAQPRTPTKDDPAGGIFLSPRDATDPDAITLYGKGNAGRIHGATDWKIPPGKPIFATMTGRVGPIGKTETGFPLVTIQAPDGTRARELYVEPTVKTGDQVRAGETIIGHSVDLSKYKGYAGVPNHVHTDFFDGRGRKFDPYTNYYIESEAGQNK